MSTLVIRIESAIKDIGVTFNRVEHDCGLGNGTIKRWGEQSPRLDKLVLVSEYLHVSLDYLVFGTIRTENTPNREGEFDLSSYKVEQGLTCDGTPLDEDEIDMIAMRRLLPPEHRQELFDLTYFKYERLVDKKGTESIYSTYFEDAPRQISAPDESDEAHIGTA